MKKIVLFISLIVMTLTITAQTPTPDQPITETERIVDKYLDRAEDAISALAEKLSVPAEHVYTVLVKQQVIIGVSITFGFIVLLIVFIISTKIGIKNNWRDEAWGTISIVSGLIAFVLFVVFFAKGLPALLNPEYGAIKDILNIIQ